MRKSRNQKAHSSFFVFKMTQTNRQKQPAARLTAPQKTKHLLLKFQSYKTKAGFKEAASRFWCSSGSTPRPLWKWSLTRTSNTL